MARLTQAQKDAKAAEVAKLAEAEAAKLTEATATPAKADKAPKVATVFQNGVRHPKGDGLCAQVWRYIAGCATLPTVAEVKTWGETQKMNINNVQIEYYAYRKFHGIRGRGAVTAPTLAPVAASA